VFYRPLWVSMTLICAVRSLTVPFCRPMMTPPDPEAAGDSAGRNDPMFRDATVRGRDCPGTRTRATDPNRAGPRPPRTHDQPNGRALDRAALKTGGFAHRGACSSGGCAGTEPDLWPSGRPVRPHGSERETIRRPAAPNRGRASGRRPTGDPMRSDRRRRRMPGTGVGCPSIRTAAAPWPTPAAHLIRCLVHRVLQRLARLELRQA
jgi:hypothetical protein